jgi:uncharacterized Zn finger protein
MVKREYGVTPWGARLRAKLQSLGGRIGSGEQLARTDKVYDTRVRGSSVTTKVKGRSSPYYNVSCRWEPITEENKRSLKAIVSADVALCAEILAGSLPIELLDKLEEADIPILPRSYVELHGDCDCPDNRGADRPRYYAGTRKAPGDPCKHQAALLFQLIAELDKNPASLLALRGVDLQSTLGLEGGSTISSKGSIPFPLPVIDIKGAATPRRGRSRTKSQVVKTEDGVIESGDQQQPLRNKIMFAPMESSAKVIVQSLSGPPPLFSPVIDYTAVIAEFYGSLNGKMLLEKVGNILEWESNMDVDSVRRVLERGAYGLSIPAGFTVANATVTVESDLWNSSESAGATADDANPMKARTPEQTLGSIPFQYLAKGPKPKISLTLDTFRRILIAMPGDGTVGSQSYRFFFHVIRAGLLLLFSANFVPDVVPLDKERSGKNWTIIYRPFSSSNAVQMMTEALQGLYPNERGCVSLKVKAKGAFELRPQNAEAGTLQALSAILTELVCALEFKHKKSGKKGCTREAAAFFSNEVYVPLSLQEQSNGLAAKRWLSVFDLLSVKAEILLRITESDTDNTFDMELFLKPESAANRHRKNGSGEEDHRSSGGKLTPFMDLDAGGWLLPNMYMKLGTEQAVDTLKFMMALKGYIPEVRTLLQAGSARISAEGFENFILEKAGVLQALGVTYLLPRGIRSVLRPRLVTHMSRKADAGSSSWRHSYMQLTGMMDFEYKVALGDDLVDLAEFEAMVDSGRRLFRFKESFIQLDPKNVESILKAKNCRPPLPSNSLEVIRDLISNTDTFVKSADARELIASIRLIQPVVVPASLRACLRDYQVRGFQWMCNNVTKLGGCILADDMGLGKTVQTIALLLHMNDAGSFDMAPGLVVCPTSLLSNWMREVRRFAPSLWVKICDGTNRLKDVRAAVGRKRKRAVRSPEIILLSYSTLRIVIADLRKVQLPIIVLDEAQNIKNHSSQISKLCKQLGGNALARVALTGTVVENRLVELHSCFDFVLPGYLGMTKEFVDRFSKPIERDRDPNALALLKRMTEPFMLRRLKSDPAIISDLPKKIESKHWVSLSKEQAALYESVRTEIFKELAAEPVAGGGIKRSGLVLKLLVALKQICDHPACYENDRRSTDAERSQKCMALLDLLEPIVESGEKVLIFSQYVRMCRILEEQIAVKFAIRPLVYEGSLRQAKRDEVLQQFDKDPARQVLILSLRAGGVGLNLT